MIIRAKLIKEIGLRLEALELNAEMVSIKGFNRENGTIKQLVISTNYHDSGRNVASQIKDMINSVEDEYEIVFNQMYLGL